MRVAPWVSASAALAALAALVFFTVDVAHAPVPERPGPAAQRGEEDDDLLAQGERAFYAETFGNEAVFGSDVGLLEGPLSLGAVADAILALDGAPTTDLRVALTRDVSIAGRVLRAGELVDTGLDVPAGGLAPLGVSVGLRGGRVQVGITCALCHATVDRAAGGVLSGVPNTDLALGIMLALAPRSAVLAGTPAGAPHPEDTVDRALVAWPPGRVDATMDGTNNPSDIPGLFGARPFRPGGFHPAGDEASLASIAAWASTLAPPLRAPGAAPDAPADRDDELAAEGHAVFVRAGCARCHAGPALGDDAMLSGARTPGLIGLGWSAPYLHDGGAAVGADALRDVGVLATALRGVPSDPTESLRAVVDRTQREAVIAANRIAGLGAVRVTGAGHPFWVDERSGFDRSEQDALLAFLLGYRADPAELRRPAPEREVAAVH